MIPPLQAAPAVMAELTPSQVDVVSIDARMRDAFIESSVAAQHETLRIMEMASNPDAISDPDKLFALQERLGNHRLEVEIISALSRKVVGAFETVMRA